MPPNYKVALATLSYCSKEICAHTRYISTTILGSKAKSWPGRKTYGDRRGRKPQNTAQLNAHTTHTFRQPFRQYQTSNTASPPTRHWPTHPIWGCAVPFCQGHPPMSESTGFLIGLKSQCRRNLGTTASYVVGAGVPLTLIPGHARHHQSRTHASPPSNRI